MKVFLFICSAYIISLNFSFGQQANSKEERAVLAAYDYYVMRYMSSPNPMALPELENTRFYTKTAYCLRDVSSAPLFGEQRLNIYSVDIRRVEKEWKTGCKNTKRVFVSKKAKRTRKYFIDKFLPKYLEQDTLNLVLMSHPVKIRKDLYYMEFAKYSLVKGKFRVHAYTDSIGGDGRFVYEDSRFSIDALSVTHFLYDDKNKQIVFPEGKKGYWGWGSPDYCSFMENLIRFQDLKFFWNSKVYKCP